MKKKTYCDICHLEARGPKLVVKGHTWRLCDACLSELIKTLETNLRELKKGK